MHLANATQPSAGILPSMSNITQLDPNLITGNFFTELQKKCPSKQQKLGIVNGNRTFYIQQAMSSMAAATNLFKLMVTSNWGVKSPSK